MQQSGVKESVDIFHRGRFCLVQPLKCGHRAGMDAMMLAAAVPQSFNGHLADLGAGAGAAGFAVASRCLDARITLIERSPFMLDFAEKSCRHPTNKDIAARIEIISADVTLTGRARVNAGLPDHSFDFAIMNPPFNSQADRQTPDATKAEAHVMEDGLFESWARTASAIVRPGGDIAMIARPQSLVEIMTALDKRFGNAKIIPIYPRAHREAIRIIVTAKRGSRANLAFMPPLILHEAQNNAFSAKADAIANGRSSLWDVL